MSNKDPHIDKLIKEEISRLKIEILNTAAKINKIYGAARNILHHDLPSLKRYINDYPIRYAYVHTHICLSLNQK